MARAVSKDWVNPKGDDGGYESFKLEDMPHWGEGEKTHYMIYDQDGYPISRLLANKKQVESWLYHNWMPLMNSNFCGYE